MSLDAYVRCTCIRDGKARKPHPLPDRFTWDESNAPSLTGDPDDTGLAPDRLRRQLEQRGRDRHCTRIVGRRIADVLRGLIGHTQAGHEVNVVVTGINVGGQPYWNAEATMLMHTRGILVMLPTSAMVLTGKQALDFSGGVSAEDNLGIGGYDRVMGPNGQAQYWASGIEDAGRLLLRHYDHTYVVPGERFPRRAQRSR